MPYSKKPNKFIKKVFKIVNSENYSSIVYWSEEGTSFLIKDPEAFSSVVLKENFKHKNLGSFIRQLNMYGFHKKRTRGEEPHEFFHEFFRKDRPDMLRLLQRKVSSTNDPSPNKDPSYNQLSAQIKKQESTIQELQNKILELELSNNYLVQVNQRQFFLLTEANEKQKSLEHILNIVSNYCTNFNLNQNYPW